MNVATALALVLAVLQQTSAATPGADTRAETPLTAAALAGIWSGTVSKEGEQTRFALELSPQDDGTLAIRGDIPVIHVSGANFGKAKLVAEGDQVHLGLFDFTYDEKAGTLTGAVPAALVPYYRLPFTLRRAEALPRPTRPEPTAPFAKPVWVFSATSPLWAGATYADGTVYAGAEDGRLHALDASSGSARWSFRAGGAIRSRPTVDAGHVYVQADDGILYDLDAKTGAERWRATVVGSPIVRKPLDDPESRYDRFAADVTVAGARLYVGTHDGHLLALERSGGERAWDFAAGDSVLAAPTVAGGRVYFGSYDGFVYALDAGSGRLEWKRDTHGPVVSTPAVAGDRLVIGNRCYDLLGLDATTGDVAWTHYVWFSWVESSATLRDEVAYIGSSDAAAAFAFDARSGALLWSTDVHGWAWGQPAVTDGRVYVGVSSQVGYLASHRGGVLALDRRTGRPVWRFDAPAPDSGAYGFPGSPAVGAGSVFFTGLDGRVYAFSA